MINKLSSHPEHQLGDELQVPLQIGMASTLLLLLILIVVYLIKRETKCVIPSKPKPTKTQPEGSEPYLYLEDVEQLLPAGADDGVIFTGLADVRISYDGDQKRYTLGLRTQSVNEEGSTTHEIKNQNYCNADHLNVPVKTLVTTRNLASTSCASNVPVSEGQNRYLEMKDACNTGEDSNQYLHVVNDAGQIITTTVQSYH
jgi:hypothetical protein